ncbi:MAG: insulinase family protein [Alistipes sp.]|nr:insulinase family protein [Alistipes sp.]
MQQPDIVMPRSVDMPHALCRTTENGVKIYSLPTDDFEVVRFTLVFRAGTSVQLKPFVASSTLNMLGEGSSTMTAQQIADELDFYGSYFDVNIDRDYTYISFCSLSKFFAPTIKVAREIVLHPIFPERELKTYCEKRKQSLKIERRKIEVQSRELFAKALFGAEHPYGISASEECYDDVAREDVVAMYERCYTADNCFVVMSGRIDDEVMSAVEELVAGLSRGEICHVKEAPTETTYCLHREVNEALQSSIRIGRLLFPRTHPDFVGMQVVASILGGYFGSRLMSNLREEHGYTYGVSAAMINFDREGYFALATQVAREHRDDALREIYSEIERLRVELVSEEELEMVKNVMIGEILRILDGPFGIADVTIENIMCGMDNEATERSVEAIAAITAEEIRDLAYRYLERDKLVEVVVG